MNRTLRTASGLLLATFILAFAWLHAMQIEPGQVDDFGDGTTMGWMIGLPADPNAPTVEDTGGPAGSGDAFLVARSTGAGGPGSKFVIFNDAQWSGDYTEADVDHIAMHVNNLGNEELFLRLRIESSSGGSMVSVDPVIVPATPGWQLVLFPARASDFTGGTDAEAALTTVIRLRLFHGVTTTFPPAEVEAELGIDNISAVPGDTGVEETNLPLTLQVRSVYPNPAGQVVHVELANASGRTIDVGVVDVLGRRVATWPAVVRPGEKATVTGAVDELPTGVYWITLADGPARASSRFVVSR